MSQQGVSSGEVAVGVERCNVVVVDCRSSDIPLFSVVRSGSRFGDCVVVFASPDPCVFSRRTQVREGVMCSVEEVGLVNNVVVRVSCGDGVSKELIYPKKTYYLVKSGYIEPLKRGSPPISSGLILAGPPGTGKSELAVAVALSLGIVPRRVMPSDILSMWIGNSEKALDRVFREARESQPSVLIIDDAEFLIRPRALASSVVGTGEVLTNLQNIMFYHMQEISSRGERVLVVATTNVKPSEIDQAFMRFGRFGDPIMVPLPDEEAMRYYLERNGAKDAAVLARRFVNAGLTIVDAKAYLSRGGEIPRRSGRGYSRIVAEPVDVVWLEKHLSEKKHPIVNRYVFSSPSRICFQANHEVVTAVVAQISYVVSRPIIKITDYRWVDEAVHAANSIGGIIIAPGFLPPEAIAYISVNAQGPVVYTEPLPSTNCIRLSLQEVITLLGKRYMFLAVAAYKEIKLSKEIIDRFMTSVPDEKAVEYVLNYMSLTSNISEEVLLYARELSRRL